ncbi:MAG: PaaX family transcriptional regulator C-terminal domain-containing protein [Pararhodobacter sp.]
MTIASKHWAMQGALASARATIPLRAAGFIVTLFGDAVVPRGGEVWTGNIIATSAALGISETLVRTALSRLVAAGRLESRRTGRRSYYRLSPDAGPEFEAAARSIYGSEPQCGWRFVFLPEGQAESLMAQLERNGYARLRQQLAVGPDRLPPPPDALSFTAAPEEGLTHLPAFAASAWDLAAHADAYAGFIAHFTPLAHATTLPPAEALTARLLLVHAYRHVLLRDPRLPLRALPPDWSGHAARQLFARCYLALSDAAERHIAATFQAMDGPLPRRTAATEAPLQTLRRLLTEHPSTIATEIARAPLAMQRPNGAASA